jgi:hypothetical protein
MTSLAASRVVAVGGLPERYHPTVEPSVEAERREIRSVLDDELLRLPEKYRAPVVLCDLEGHTREEAARRLGWPTGSMSRRLDRGRSLLRHRLTGRGLTLGIIGLTSLALAATAGLRPSSGPRGASVRQVMATLRIGSEGGDGYGRVLATAARSEGPMVEFSRILPAARAAASAARRLELLDPGRPADLWLQLANEMRDSADDLERACKASDSRAVVAAARRLDASCVRCHAAFGHARPPDPVRIPAGAKIVDPPEPARTRLPGTILAATSRRSPMTTEDAGAPAHSHPRLARPVPGFGAMPGSLLMASSEAADVSLSTHQSDDTRHSTHARYSTGWRCPPVPAWARIDFRDSRCRSDGLPA